MALAHFQRTFTDASGNVKPGLSVTVRRESDNGLAALFADAGSVTPKSNPFNTDANGYGSFYAVNERYRIQATDIDWRDEDLISQPDLAASLAAISTNTSDISTNTSDILERAELSGGPLANFTTMPQVGGDPIVESGSNSNGQYTKFSDGTLVCTSNGETTFAYDTADQLLYEWTYPAAFSTSPPSLSWVVANRNSLIGAPDIVQEVNVSSSTTSLGVLRFWSSGGTGPFSPGDSCTGILTAIGRWF